MRPALGVCARVCALVLAAAGCDTPAVPTLPGPYDFRLAVYGADGSVDLRTFHWNPGAEVPVFVAEGGSGDADLHGALERAAEEWRTAAAFGEVRLRRATHLDEARVVLRWHDATTVLSTPLGCLGPTTGATSTLGCLTDARDALQSWPRKDGGASQVIFRVIIRATTDPELVDRLVVHELGHALGILSHSPDPSDVMWAGPSLPPAPSDRDRATLRSLYQTPGDLPIEAQPGG